MLTIRSASIGILVLLLALLLGSNLTDLKDMTSPLFGRLVGRLGNISVLPPARTFKARGIRAPSITSDISKSLPSSSTRSFSATTPTMSSSFLDAVKGRRSVYALTNKPPISDARIEEIAKETILHVPSSFNSQSARLVVLLKAEHEKFWELVKEVLKPQVPAEAFGKTVEKLDGFKAGYGTVLFFEDPTPVEKLQKAFPLYSDHFPQWSEHTSAMHQFVLWTALEAEGLGANLQHYNPVVDQRAKDVWGVPQTWGLKAQLVFGGKAAEASEKQFGSVEDRLFVHGK